jgi:ribosomal protein S18 acetylase RimI-like enzyme
VAVSLDPALPVHIEVDAAEHQADLLHLAERAGFAIARRFLEVVRPTDLVPPLARPVEHLELVPWASELDEATRFAHVEAFADHWGSEPRSREEWRQWHTGHRSFRPDLSRLVVDPATATVVAFVLVAAYPTDWETGPREAWVQDVGTRPTGRRQGAAAWALTDSLRAISAARDGFERVILGVDADNPTGALPLYRGLGFADLRASLRLVLVADAARPAG